MVGRASNHALYNLNYLARAGLIAVQAEAGFTRYFPRATDRGLARDVHGAMEKKVLGALRKPVRLRVVLVLLHEGALPLRDLSVRLGSPASSLSHHLSHLVDRSVLERLGGSTVDRRYAVLDAEAVLRLLMRHPPQRDLIGAFIDLWDGLALPGAEPGPGARRGEARPVVEGTSVSAISVESQRLGVRKTLHAYLARNRFVLCVLRASSGASGCRQAA